MNQLKLYVTKVQGKLESLKAELEKVNEERQIIELELPALNEAILLARKCLEESLEQRKFIETIVSSALTEVFGVPFTFILDPVHDKDGSIKGLKPLLKQGDEEFRDPLSSFGAAVQTIASITFRFANLFLSTGTAKVMILDEPLANVSPALQNRFRNFIINVCKDTGLQIIMTTHMTEPFGKVYKVEFSSKNKGSTVTDVTDSLGEI